MDTAFKRRWDFEYIGIDKGEGDVKDGRCPLKIVAYENGNTCYQFTYVGIIVVENILIIVYPEYIETESDKNTLYKKMMPIFAVLIKHGKEKAYTYNCSETSQTESLFASFIRIQRQPAWRGILLFVNDFTIDKTERMPVLADSRKANFRRFKSVWYIIKRKTVFF